MSICHKATARQCEQDATILHALRERLASTPGEYAAFKSIFDNLLGIADALNSGHLVVAEADDQELSPDNLHAATKSVLTPYLPQPIGEPVTDDLIGTQVTIIREPYSGHTAIIKSFNHDGAANVNLAGSTIQFCNLRPGIDIGHQIFSTKAS